MRLLIATTAIVSAFLIGPVSAQEETLSEVIAKGITIGKITINENGQAVARVSETATPDLAVANGFYLIGTVKPLQMPGLDPSISSGQFSWVTLSDGPEMAGQKVAPLSPRLASAALSRTKDLPDSSEIEVLGDPSALKRAAEELQDKEDPEEEDDEKDEIKRDSDGQRNNEAATGSQANENDKVQIPELKVTEKATPAEVAETVYGESIDGCFPQYDEASNQMIVYKSPTETVNNVTTKKACEPSLDRLEVKTTDLGCKYVIEDDKSGAHPSLRRFYTYNGATSYIDEQCVPDEETTYPIENVTDGCSIVPDWTTNAAIQHSRLIFMGTNNEKVEVPTEGCKQRDDSQTWPIETEIAQGTYDDDFTGKTSYELGRPVYYRDGVKVKLGEYERTETAFEHVKDFDACTPVPNYGEDGTGTLVYAYRIRIDTETGPNYRTPICQLDQDRADDLMRTIDGCEYFHRDYFEEGFSRGGARWINTETNVALTDCAESTDNYEHSYVQEGWDPHDTDHQAFAKHRTEITLPSPTGKTVLEQAFVRDATPPTPYIFVRKADAGTGSYTYADCDKYQTTATFDYYTRPNGTEYKENVGDGAPIVEGNACDPVVTWDGANPSYSRGATVTGSGTEALGMPYFNFSCRTYRSEVATLKIVRDDGTVISSATNTGSIWDQSHTSQYSDRNRGMTACNLYSWAGYPTSISNSQKANFESAWGW